MAILINLKVVKNGNYVPYDSSCQKWQFLLTSKLPKMAIKGLICYSIENFSHFFAISGNILLHKVAKNGNYLPYDSSCQKQQYLTAHYYSIEKLQSLFLPFLAIFCISVSKNACQKLPKMAIFIDLKVAKNGK